jgi:hypothetical protein
MLLVNVKLEYPTIALITSIPKSIIDFESVIFGWITLIVDWIILGIPHLG